MENVLLTIRADELDNVATAVTDLPRGAALRLSLVELPLVDDIPAGHKLALEFIKKGSPIVKWGYEVGSAAEDIQPGEHVHVHNVKDCISSRGEKAS